MEMQNPAPAPKKSGFSPEIMDTLQKQNEPKKEMSAADIVKHDVESEGGGMPWHNVYAGLITAVKSPKFRIMRANNSLMTFSNRGNGMVVAHLITADDPKTLIDSLKQFHQAMIKAGFKKAQSTVTNPQIIKALKMAGIKVTESMGQQMDGGTASPAINIVMEA